LDAVEMYRFSAHGKRRAIAENTILKPKPGGGQYDALAGGLKKIRAYGYTMHRRSGVTLSFLCF
ncbi:MAG TPA: hypothetical protein VKZ46_06405, partial [Pedomonas sp.]|nr:hypothetical protein [Pedomonas sp.]